MSCLLVRKLALGLARLGIPTPLGWGGCQYYNNTLTYYGENKRNRSNIHLQGAAVGGNAQRRIYTWRNGDIRYQVAWRPSEPHTIRVQVFNGRGQEILNQLLTRV